MLIRGVYRLLSWLIFPLIWLYLLKRSLRQPEYRLHWAERLGFYGATPIAKRPRIWLHAVSVGEMRAAVPVLKALREQHPDHDFVITCMTPTGRATAAEIWGGTVTLVYLPYDYPGAVARFLRRFQPQMGLLLETELWPNLIHACADRQIPLWLVNARLSAKSLAGYQRIRLLIQPAMARLAGVLAQASEDAERLQLLGAQRITVMGNVKFDLLPSPERVALGRRWRGQIGHRPVLLFASSREGEEALLLDILQNTHLPPETLLLLVPRHPQRFAAVAEMLAARGLSCMRRSVWPEGVALDTSVQVLLGDSMGEMAAYFAAADVAIMGGSLLPFGCQNLIEACAVGTPVVVGPSTFNFAEVVQAALAEGAAQQGLDVVSVVNRALDLLVDPSARIVVGQAGLAFASRHRGATQRLLAGLQ